MFGAKNKKETSQAGVPQDTVQLETVLILFLHLAEMIQAQDFVETRWTCPPVVVSPVMTAPGVGLSGVG